MAEESAKLRIPYIAASQAQKHVTHNEAMTLLDTLVQLGVLDKDLEEPPAEPEEGDTYIVAGSMGGSAGTGAWTGWDARVVRFIDGEWRSYLPGAGSGAGWLAYVIDEAALYVFTGTDWEELAIGGGGGGREILTADRTYYVRSDGSDANNGLTDSSGGAFLTLQKAVDAVAAIDLASHAVTIQVGAGTYARVSLKSYVGAGPVTLRGDPTTPSNVVINNSTTGEGCITQRGVPALWIVNGFRLAPSTGTTGARGLYVDAGSNLQFLNVDFAATSSLGTTGQVEVDGNSFCQAIGNYSISGGGGRHCQVWRGGIFRANTGVSTVTVSGTPAFAVAFAVVSHTGVFRASPSYSGSATGARYSVASNGVIDTNGGGASFLPGDAAGSTATGGEYL